jgi:hypothetical protein
MQIAVRVGFRIQADKGSIRQHARYQGLVFRSVTAAPVNIIRTGQGFDLVNPGLKIFIGGHVMNLQKTALSALV